MFHSLSDAEYFYRSDKCRCPRGIRFLSFMNNILVIHILVRKTSGSRNKKLKLHVSGYNHFRCWYYRRYIAKKHFGCLVTDDFFRTLQCFLPVNILMRREKWFGLTISTRDLFLRLNCIFYIAALFLNCRTNQSLMLCFVFSFRREYYRVMSAFPR